MELNSELNETLLGDIILCDPITSRGKKSLANLHLSEQDITPEFFYKFLCVGSKYHEQAIYNAPNTGEESALNYQYTLSAEQFEEIKNRLVLFNACFTSDKRDEHPLLILGVAGNGKSVEVVRRIYKATCKGSTFNYGQVYFDLENAFSEVTYGITFRSENPKSALDIFFIKLLDGTMQYVSRHREYLGIAYNNFTNIMVEHNLANDEQKHLFSCLNNYRKNF